jgi:hypothetical protein
VKPIHLNLASRPYRDYRPVYAVVVVMSLLTAFLALNNIETYFRYQHDTRNTSSKIAQLDVKIQKERELQGIAERQLKALDLASLDAQTRFVNAKLAERAFSWSALLDEMESVVAADVRLVSIAPSFTVDGPIPLNLAFEAKSGTGMTSTIDRMNADPQFSDAFPSVEAVTEAGGYTFNLTVNYSPAPAKPASVTTGSAR